MFPFAGLFKTLFLAESSITSKRVYKLELRVINSYLNPEDEAIVTQTIEPGRSGQIKYRGSWWMARCRQTVRLFPGAIVYVVGRHVTTLYVEPLTLPISEMNALKESDA